jgi:hypothetical protein
LTPPAVRRGETSRSGASLTRATSYHILGKIDRLSE